MTPAETTSILTWWLAGGLFVAGLFLGTAIYAVICHRYHKQGEVNPASEQQLNNLRAALLKHFAETSAVVQQLGTDYQTLVEKLSQGMHELSTSADGKPLMPPIFPPTTKHTTKNTYGRTEMPKTYVDPKDSNKD